MERRVAIHHLSASKANQVEEFPFKHFKELTIGRDPSCEVKYNPDSDDLISRRHAKIVIEKEEPPEFSISDLGSRNGTFINKQRIFGPSKLVPGDIVQLGAGGPEFKFEVDPPMQGAARPTRLAGSGEVVLAPTREAPTREAPSGPSPVPTALPPHAAPAGVGKATVERMIAETKSQTRRNSFVIGGVLVVLIAAVAAFVALRKPQVTTITNNVPVTADGLNPAQIAATYVDSVVLVEVAWKMVSIESGGPIYQVYAHNAIKDDDGKVVPRWNIDMEYLPVFITVGDNREPLLTTNDGGGKNKAIGESGSGSGFVISSDGFILTNRHVAAGWNTSYSWGESYGVEPGVVEVKGKRIKTLVPISSRDFPNWVPANAKFLCQGSCDADSVRNLAPMPSGKMVDGRNDYLEVTFAKNRIRIPAKTARISDHADIAMIKIDLPRSVHKTELNDNYDTIKQGETVTVMGYPGASPMVVGAIASADPLNREASWREIPDPTLSTGNIARIVRGQVGLSESTVSKFGDVYQLTVNTTGHGNSGGPVFDDHGRVIGIFTYGIWRPGEPFITFAVPIKYGMELMGVGK